jgi:hypothetical protein
MNPGAPGTRGSVLTQSWQGVQLPGSAPPTEEQIKAAEKFLDISVANKQAIKTVGRMTLKLEWLVGNRDKYDQMLMNALYVADQKRNLETLKVLYI